MRGRLLNPRPESVMLSASIVIKCYPSRARTIVVVTMIKNDATILATVPTSLKEDRDLYYCDREMKNNERKDVSVMTNKEEQCAREDDKKMM